MSSHLKFWLFVHHLLIRIREIEFISSLDGINESTEFFFLSSEVSAQSELCGWLQVASILGFTGPPSSVFLNLRYGVQDILSSYRLLSTKHAPLINQLHFTVTDGREEETRVQPVHSAFLPSMTPIFSSKFYLNFLPRYLNQTL